MAGRFAFQKLASGMSRSTGRLSARASASARATAPVILAPRASEAGMGTISTEAAVDSSTALANNSAIHDYEDGPGLSDEGDWKLIWRLEVPPKVRVFWWRVMHEFLPARQILHGRHIERLAVCEVCGADQETIRHVLLECTMAKLFWENTKKLAGVKIPHMHPETWARDLLLAKVCPRREAAAIICGIWALWVARDRRHHGEQPIQVRRRCTACTEDCAALWEDAEDIANMAGKMKKAKHHRRRVKAAVAMLWSYSRFIARMNAKSSLAGYDSRSTHIIYLLSKRKG